jgi:DNA-binding FadR family transcriptional regulator
MIDEDGTAGVASVVAAPVAPVAPVTTTAVGARGRRLAELILAETGRAGLGTGSRLPTERQLAASLGVTRSGVRQALAALEADGLISREVGRGTFLMEAGGRAASALRGAGPESGVSLSPATDFAPADVMTVRRMLEPQAMPLVVVWATARDFAEMDRCLAGGDGAETFEEFESWDLALHRSIMAATHSGLLTALYSVIEHARHGHIWGDLKRRSSSRERRQLYQADHHAIVTALRARDADAAVEAMRTHLGRVSGHLLGETR